MKKKGGNDFASNADELLWLIMVRTWGLLIFGKERTG
jgi:hypothetical protein